MRGFSFRFSPKLGALSALVVFLSLTVSLRSQFANAGIQWGISERNQWLTTNGTIDARVGDTVRFRFYWYDPDVAGGQSAAHPDKVKLHVCKNFSGLSDRQNGGRCFEELVGSDWISQLPSPYTELSYSVTGDEVTGCDAEVDPECRFSFTFWVCDSGAGDPSKAECRNEKGCATSGTDPSRPECLDASGTPISVGGGTLKILGNNKPIANNQSVTVQEDSTLSITLAGSDPDGDPITFQADTPANGTLNTAALNEAKVIYTPRANYSGADSFTFTTRDRTVASNPGTVSITVTPVNDAPIVTSYFVNKTTGEAFDPHVVKSVTAGQPMNFEVGWQEWENDLVKVHICGTNALVSGSERAGGQCAVPLVSASGFSGSSPQVLGYTPPLADGGKDKTYYVFVCDNHATDGKCSRPEFNSGIYHVNTAYPLTLTVTGSGTVSAPGISCPTDCTENFVDGTGVTLTATPTSGHVLDTWTGACSGSTTTCSVTMDAAKSVQAVFKPTHRLSISISGGGEVKSDVGTIDCKTGNTGTCSDVYAEGRVVVLTPTPDPGFTFASWSGGGCTGRGPCSVTMNQAHTITATFLPSYKIILQKDPAYTGLGTVVASIVSAPPGGSTTGFTCSVFPCEQSYVAGTRLNLVESHSATAVFGGWSGGGCSGTANPCTVTLNADTTVIAQFRANYNLTLTKAGSGAVTMSPSGSSCGTDCGIYAEKTVVTLGATAATGFIFTGWSGDADCTDGNVTMNSHTTCRATFGTAITLTLRLPTSARGTGDVVSTAITPPAGQPTPAPITCSLSPSNRTCTSSFLQGTRVDLRETPTGTPVSVFSGWSGGGCSGTSTTCTGIVLNSDTTIDLDFRAQFTLTVTKQGNGLVTSSSPASPTISCGTTCSQNFVDGTLVTLGTNGGDAGFIFTNWTSVVPTPADAGFVCPGSAGCQVTMDRARTVQAHFRPSYTLQLTKGGSGTGTLATVTVTAPGGVGPTTAMTCGASCGPTSYLQGTQITLRATASSSPLSIFTGWTSGGCSGTADCTITLNGNTTVNGNFQATNPLTVQVTGPGRVSTSPAGITNCTANCTANFADNVSVTLTQTATGSGQFIRWQGDCSGSGACSVSMAQARTVQAIFSNRPVANAGPSHAFPVGTNHTHSGATATDVDGDIVSYQWVPTQCPGGGCAGVGPVTVSQTGNLTVPGPTYTATTPGEYRWTLTVTDATGATGTAILSEVTATPPDTQLTGCPVTRDAGGAQASCASGGGAQFKSRASTASFTFTGTDPETPSGLFTFTYWLYRDGSLINTQSCAGCGSKSYTSSDITVGHTYRFEVAARDGAPSNLTDASPATFTWTTEPNTPPTVTLTNTSLGYSTFQSSNIASFTFGATDAPPDNPLTFQCEVDGVLLVGNCATLNSGQTSSVWTRTGIASGSHTVRVRATDGLGAQGWSSPYTWYVPLVTIAGGPSGSTIDSDANFTFTGRDDDGDSLTYECQVQVGGSALPNASAWQSCGSGADGTYTYSNSTLGTYKFFVRAWDRTPGTGNVSATVERVWTVSNVAVNPQPVSSYTVASSLTLRSNGLAVLAAGTDTSIAGPSTHPNIFRCQDRSCGSVTSTPTYAPGVRPSVKVDDAGNIHVSSVITSIQDFASALEYARFDGTAWTVSRVDSALAGAALDSSLVLRSDGTPMIFYSKETSTGCGIGNGCAQLKVAYPTPGTGCNGSSWTCTSIDSITNNDQPYAGLAADYDWSDAGPRVVYGFSRTLRFAACNDQNCSSSSRVTMVSSYDYGAVGNNVDYVRAGGMDHVLRVADSSCNSSGCRWEYVRSPGNTLTFTTVLGSVATAGRAAITTDVNNFPVFAIPGISLRYCQDVNCSSVVNNNVYTTGVLAGIDIEIGSDNIPRLVYSNGSSSGTTGSPQGSSFILCRNAYCAP